MMHIRRAEPQDSEALSDLLNEIIAIGGTTAKVTPVSAQDIVNQMKPSTSVWHLAEDSDGVVLGFQYFDLHPSHPKDAANIATFVRVGRTGMGIGSGLFHATTEAARSRGFNYIDATIRTDNTGGLAYYKSRGFEYLRDLPNIVLDDGTIVDKVWTRYNLD